MTDSSPFNSRIAPNITILLAGAALLFLACDQSRLPLVGGSAPATGAPNLLLISIDTLRADHLSLYGYERDTSPYLDRFAEDAVVFDQYVHNGGFTLPVHMSLMTSLTPGVHNVLDDNNHRLESDRTTLAEQLQATGFRTAAFTDGGWLKANWGFGQGFESFDDSDGKRFKSIIPLATDWLDENGDSRFFLFLHTYDVHTQWQTRQPYSCSPPFPNTYTTGYSGSFDGCFHGKCATNLLVWINKQIWTDRNFQLENVIDSEALEWLIALYDGCINYVDEQLGFLFDHLRQLGIYDNTMIIVLSDHGEEFLDHGLLIHQNKPYEEMLRVPLAIKFPHSRFAGTRVSSLAAVIDVMPTILDAFDLPIGSETMGVSLMPSIEHGRPVRKSAHMSSAWSTGVSQAIRAERWKFIKGKDREFLFDLHSDPREKRNLVGEEPEMAREMARLLEQATLREQGRRASFESTLGGDAPKLELSDEEIKQLKALGYLQ